MAEAQPVADAEQDKDFDPLLRGGAGWIASVLLVIGVAISLLHLYFNVFGVLSGLWRNALHFAGFAVMCGLIYPAIKTQTEAAAKRVLVFDIGFGLLAAFAAVYMIWMEDAIYERGVRLSEAEWVFGSILVLAAIEFTRRTTGWIIPVLILLSLTYVGWWGALIDGVFRFGGLSAETILFRSIYGDDGLFGNIARIS